MTRSYASFLILLPLLLAACAPPADPPSATRSEAPASDRPTYQGAGPIKAVATVGMVADLVRNIGGDRVEVTQLMGPGVDPHLFKATRDDVAKLLAADLVFYNGLMLEGKMQDSITHLEKDKTKWPIAVTEHLDEKTLIEPSDSHGHADPHVWMDVSAWKTAAETVEGALAQFDPKHAQEYRKRGEDYRNRLQALHDYGKRTVSTIPHDQRVLITSHDAFSYFGRAYGLRVYGVQGISTDSEAGLQQINALVDQIVKKGVKAVFIESSVPRKNIEALVGGAKARGHEVKIGGELYSDAMGPAGTYEGTYEGMLDHNITTVTSGLGGRAPAGGMQGKLSTASGK